ncbi:hypothetical protein CHS0354_037519 [Potamilus streckersoni]|uniref:Next to BRCA1 gene 1 protein n=1 Tax=Potamilus streckersoni TaxID=2493646 RepID=A0AAE0RPY5_9BIVA|nr:hypothetical protein CHS0354_037519 [Potamilus streckersoni]
MDDFVALDICFDVTGGYENDTFRIPYVTSWMDIEAMLKAQYDCDHIEIFYQDDDNDQITVSSEIEWCEALRLAKKTDNVLSLIVYRSTRKYISELELIAPERSGLEGLLMDTPSPPDKVTVVSVPTEKLRNIINEEAVLMEMRSDMENCVLNTEETGEMSPNDLTRDAETGAVMPKLKRDLHQDIVRDVTKKTVRHVLKGLDGAVIESIHGTKGIPLTSASEKGNAPSALLHPVYAHDGVICDNCNKTIIGARYKCGNCLDYDLCEECEALNGVHDEEHVFIKIRRPCKRAGVKDGVRRTLLKHIIYRPREKRETTVEVLEKRQIQLDDPIQFSFESSRLQEKLARKQEKLIRREEKKREKYRKKEEKMKRRFDGQMDCPLKRERLEGSDLSQQRSSPVTYDFYRVMMGAQFLQDVSIPDGTTVQPGTKLLKTWKMKNNGDGPWTESTKLKHLWGNIPAVKTEVDVPHLMPGDDGQITVELIAPDEQGTYQSHWKMTEHGMQFGHRIWCSIEVQPKEILEPNGKDKLKVVEDTLTAERKMEEETDVDAEKPYEIIFRNEAPLLLREATTQMQASQKGEANEMNKKEREEGEEEVGMKEETADKLEQDLTTAVAAMAQMQLQEVEEKIEPEQEYEMLTLQAHKCHISLVSQTATPNNTPRVVTPPMSPTPEQEEEDDKDSEVRPISKSSSVEIVSAHDCVEYHMASLTELKPEIDLESLNTDSSYELDYDSSLSEDDYIIVHMDLPDCFDPNKPLSRSTQLREDQGELDSNHNTIFSGNGRDLSVDDILTASGSLSTPPLNPTVAISSWPVKSDSVSSQLSSPAEGATDLVTVKIERSFVPFQMETRLFSQDDSSAGSQSQLDEQPGAVSSPESPQGGSAVTNVSAAAAAGASADVNAPVENSDLGTSAENEDQQVKKEPVKKSSDPSTEIKMKDIKVEEQTEKKVPFVDPPSQPSNIQFKKSGTSGSGNHLNGPSSPTDIANHLVNSAVSAASRAAGQAYSTAKAVFYTWQAKTGEWKPANSNFKPPSSNGKPQDPPCKSPNDESKPPKDEEKPLKDEWKPPKADWKPSFWMAPKDEWKPPKDEWKPPKDEWKPPKEEWKPLKAEWKLQQEEWKPPKGEWKPQTVKWTSPKEAAVKEPGPMGILMEMGFFNREQNKRLLQKHENNVQAVIQELLQSSDQNWMNKRH